MTRIMTRIVETRFALAWVSAVLAAFVALTGVQIDGAHAGEPVNTGYFGGVAIRGYDPVAYFTMSKAVEGSEDITHDWMGARWQFANEEHRQAFAESPVTYAPQYGGYCTIGLAYDELVANIDPEAWFMEDGKLYLQYSKNLEADFAEDKDKFLADAELAWQRIKPTISGQ